MRMSVKAIPTLAAFGDECFTPLEMIPLCNMVAQETKPKSKHNYHNQPAYELSTHFQLTVFMQRQLHIAAGIVTTLLL